MENPEKENYEKLAYVQVLTTRLLCLLLSTIHSIINCDSVRLIQPSLALALTVWVLAM